MRDLRDAAAWLGRWARLIRELVAQGDAGWALSLVACYLVNVSPDIDVDAFARAANGIALGAGESIMTTARQLIEQGIEQGIEKGIEQGIEQGRRETLRRLLERRFGVLSVVNESRISQASTDDLDRWIDRVLEAATVDDVLA